MALIQLKLAEAVRAEEARRREEREAQRTSESLLPALFKMGTPRRFSRRRSAIVEVE